MRISQDEIENIRANADIVDVIGRYLQVHKKGKSYVALCPFHTDHSPSLSISPDKQIYKCFVCHKGGNVFTFVEMYEKVSFPEAVARVASLTGQTLSVQPEAYKQKPKDPHIEALYKVLKETIAWTTYQLSLSQASLEKEYLSKRGLDEKTCQRFEIGYNPHNDQLHQFLSAKGYPDADGVASNVIRTSANGIHDVFSGRITFPIHDTYGNPIGFSARSMDPNNESKYINTNDTEIFTKGDIVYNAHRAKAMARRAGKIYICEGVTDVIAFDQAGMENAVCTLGTACTKHQIQVIKGLSPMVVFCYDGDDAGQTATWRAAKLAQEAGCEVRIVENKTGKDPDEILRQGGKDALKQLVASEISWMEFALQYLQLHRNLGNYLEQKEYVQKAMEEVDKLTDEYDRKHFTQEVARISGLPVDYTPKKAEPTTRASKPIASITIPDGTKEAECLILCQMLNDVKASQQFMNQLGYLLDPNDQKIAMMIVDAYRNKGEVDPNRMMDSARDSTLASAITNLLTSDYYTIDYDENLLGGAIRKVEITALSNRAEKFRQQLDTPGLNPESRDVILQEYQKCLRDLRRYYDEENKEKDGQH